MMQGKGPKGLKEAKLFNSQISSVAKEMPDFFC